MYWLGEMRLASGHFNLARPVASARIRSSRSGTVSVLDVRVGEQLQYVILLLSSLQITGLQWTQLSSVPVMLTNVSLQSPSASLTLVIPWALYLAAK